jgi:hypothetical protein
MTQQIVEVANIQQIEKKMGGKEKVRREWNGPAQSLPLLTAAHYSSTQTN